LVFWKIKDNFVLKYKNMKNKFKVGEIVKEKKSSNYHIIQDFEFFDNLVLYYVSETNAFPEQNLESCTYDEYMESNMDKFCQIASECDFEDIED
jgi:hypothetical protein